MKTEILVNFLLTDFQSEPEEITRLLEITPSKTWEIGDLIHPKATLVRKSNGWQLKSSLPRSEELNKHISSIFEELNPSWPTLVELTINCYVQLSVIINIYGDDRPAIHFEPDIIKKIAEINTAIDIDLYIFEED